MTALYHREYLYPLVIVGAYTALMVTNPVRHALVDGFRCFRRYRRLWSIPAALGVLYALFRAGLTLFFYKVLPMEQQPAFGWKFAWFIPEWSPGLGEARSVGDWLGALMLDPHWLLIRGAALDGLESLAGLFNNVVTTFPFSAVAALMLLVNWENHHTTLRKALRKRLGRWSTLVHAGILVCALSAVLDPVLYGPSLLYLNRIAPALLVVRWAAVIDWLSSLFAYLFGAGVQVYLILVVYTWLRGIAWTPVHLMDLAIRRFSFVVKWSAAVLAVSSLLIDLPRVSALLFRFDDPQFLNQTLAYTDLIARPLLAIFLICFSTMQVTLTFHSESLSRAVAQHWKFIRKFWWQLFWFLLVAAIHLFALAFLNRYLLLGFGGDTTTAGILWTLARPLLSAFLAAWLLAAWVSLYKRFETGRVETADWIPF